MNGGTAVLIGVGVVAVGGAGYVAYTYVRGRQPAVGKTGAGPWSQYQGQPGYVGNPNSTQPGNPGNPSVAPPPAPHQDDVGNAAKDAALWVGVAGAVYGLASNIVGDVSNAADGSDW